LRGATTRRISTAALRPHLRGERITGIRRHRQERGELRQGCGGQPRVRPQRAQEPLPDAGELALRLGQQQPAQRAGGLVDPIEVQIPPVLVELAGHEPAITVGHHRTQLVDEHRLAHPRCAADQHCTAPAHQRLLECLVECDHVGLSAYQPRRR
jgi:hypothetical protein